ncbi:hypothetical protein SAY86_007162 [Trapa natans]|uniref:Uncharacterized protein n=1 Tax=Trapa natans TaxID=22666 RepID=A0AAN7L7S4_TRANT|nr:hypothetical protein SAY86_007162 [Trapa natans]
MSTSGLRPILFQLLTNITGNSLRSDFDLPAPFGSARTRLEQDGPRSLFKVDLSSLQPSGSCSLPPLQAATLQEKGSKGTLTVERLQSFTLPYLRASTQGQLKVAIDSYSQLLAIIRNAEHIGVDDFDFDAPDDYDDDDDDEVSVESLDTKDGL